MIALSLCLASFLAATILPFSSEVALYGAISAGLDPFLALVCASVGNVSAIVLNYYLGYFLYEKMEQKLLSSKAYHLMQHYGKWGLVFSFLPIIGDPITIVAGILQIEFRLFFIIAASLRVMRYGVLIYFLG